MLAVFLYWSNYRVGAEGEADSDYYRKIQRLDTGVVHYLGTRVVHYLGTGPKAFISVVQRFGKGLEISISIVHFTLPQWQDWFKCFFACPWLVHV